MTRSTTQLKPRAAEAPVVTSDAASPTPTQPKGKIGIVVGLLKRPSGAGLDELMTEVAPVVRTVWRLG